MLNYYYYSNYQLLLKFKMYLGLYIQYSKLRNTDTGRKYLNDNIEVYHDQRHNRRFRRSYSKRHNKERKLLHQENERQMIESIKATCPDQNAINLSTQEISVGKNPYYAKAHRLILIQLILIGRI